MTLSSTVESGDKFIYPNGLPCKIFNTTQLDCSYRELPTIPPLYDYHVNFLDLSHNQIGTVDATKFVHLGSIQMLDLSYNQLSTINGTNFVHLRSLEQLNLSWNKISKATFNVALPLRVLNLSFQIFNRELETFEITADTFSGLQNLEILDITCYVTESQVSNPYENSYTNNYCSLRFHGSPFQATPSLRSLYLSGNTIYNLTSITFSGIKQLQILDLLPIICLYEGSVTFFMVTDLLFQDLHELKILNMRILNKPRPGHYTSFPILRDLYNLQHLNLSGFQSLYPLQPTLFTGLVSLEYLDLSRSKSITVDADGFELPIFPPTLFNGLISLKHLDLSYCKLYTLPEMMNLTSLKYLDISGNCLDSIQCSVLAPLYSLSILNMSPKPYAIDINVPCNLTLPFPNLSFMTITTSLCKPSECDAVPLMTSLTWNSNVSFDPKPSLIYSKSLSDVAGLQDLVEWNSHIEYLHVKNDISSCRPWSSTELDMISIDDDAFAIFPYLTMLTELKISGFYYFTNGRQWKGLLNMSPYAFRGLTHLQTLFLNNNNLTHIPWDSLAELSHQLKYLNLNGNTIENTTLGATMTRLNLKTLNLSNNPVSILDLSLFGEDTLSKVYLQHINPKESINISTNPTLKILFVSARNRVILHANNLCKYSSELQSVSVVNFDFAVPVIFGASCERLSSLYVFNSELLQEGNETKTLYFPRLKKLTISGCNMVSIRRMLLEVPSLRYLDLSRNNITYIKIYQFRFMKNLIYLNLSRNMLTMLQLPTDLVTLQVLDISVNKLTTFPSMLLKKPWHLQHLYVGNNSFNCTCEVQPLQRFILSDKITYIDPYLPVMCESVYGRKIGFNEFDLDCRRHLEIYVSAGVASLAFIFIIVVVGTLAYKYRWLIRYKLFVLLYQRRYRRYVDNDDDADIINDDEEDNVDGEQLAMRRRYHAYVAYHPNNEDWVDEQLIPNLEEGPEQFRLCLKARDLPANRRIFDLVCHGIYHSRKTIAVLSEKFMDDGLCDYQLHVARMRLTKENDDVLILVQLGDIPDDKMTLLLRQILCNKEVIKWPDDPVGQDLFWGNLRFKLRKPTRVDRRYENV